VEEDVLQEVLVEKEGVEGSDEGSVEAESGEESSSGGDEGGGQRRRRRGKNRGRYQTSYHLWHDFTALKEEDYLSFLFLYLFSNL
jgi:hypothetical protein